MPRWQKTKLPSVYVRHRSDCPANEAGRCRCEPSYYAQARSRQTGKIVKSPTFKRIDEAAGWLADFKRGRSDQPTTARLTFNELAEQMLDAAESGAFRSKSSHGGWSDITLQVYRSNLRTHIAPAQLGHAGTYGEALVENLDVRDWQVLLDRLHRRGLAYNSIKVILAVVRTTYRYACSPSRRLVQVNATLGLEMPVFGEKKRDRFASHTEMLAYLAALEPRERVIFAMAYYAGMRRREIRPARWDWIDFDAGVIHVRESKTPKGVRDIPMVAPLRAILAEWSLAHGKPGPEELVTKGERGGMWGITNPLTRARAAWEDADLEGIGLHECRHSYASFSIAAGVNAKSLQTYMGHASITETFDRYGHLMPGNEAEAAELQDTYLRKAVGE